MFKHKTAFFTCGDKDGIPEFGNALVERDWTLYSAGGTFERIRDAGVPITDIATLPGGVGGMLNHRLLTLCPAVHAPLLSSGSPEDEAELVSFGLPPAYDLVVADFYSFADAEKRFENGEITLNELWEKIDVGGPAVVKSAIKGRKFPIVKRDRRDRFIKELDQGYIDGAIHGLALLEAIRLVRDREVAHATFIEKHRWDLVKVL